MPVAMADALTTFVSSTLGNQWVSSRQSAPSYGFGTSTREHAAKVFISPKHAQLSTMPLSPGPAKYGSKSVLGPQLILTSQPSYGMGTSERFNNLPASQRPNAYDMKDTIGGPGGFSSGTIDVSGLSSLQVFVGQGGVRTISNSNPPGTWPGVLTDARSSKAGRRTGYTSGYGGGRSEIATPAGVSLIIAGGGGGAGGAGWVSLGSAPSSGGMS